MQTYEKGAYLMLRKLLWRLWHVITGKESLPWLHLPLMKNNKKKEKYKGKWKVK